MVLIHLVKSLLDLFDFPNHKITYPQKQCFFTKTTLYQKVIFAASEDSFSCHNTGDTTGI